MKKLKYIFYGLFLLCFTKAFYMLFDEIVRGDKDHTIPGHVFYERQNLIRSKLNGSVKSGDRPGQVARVCKSLEFDLIKGRAPSVLREYRFYDRSRICACHVPKAASTTIARAILIAEYPEKADIFRNLPGYVLHRQREVVNVTRDNCFQNSATSFMVTRDPYRRLYSAYIDKIYLGKFHKLAAVLDIIYNKGVPREKLKEMIENKDERLDKWYCTVTEVTFEQFLDYVTTSENLDNHFAPISFLCDPCTNTYSVILKQENLKDDLLRMFEKIYGNNYSEKELPSITDYSGISGIENQIMSYYTHWRMWLKKKNCLINREVYNAMNRRLWNGLKVLGSIDENLDFIDELFRGPVGEKLSIRNPEAILYELKANKVPYLNAESRERQRSKALAQAYEHVDISMIKKVQALFQLDFILFDYDPVPPT